MNKVDLISHPIRMRLVAEMGQRELTTRQLANALPDIAQATLYRQIKKLHDGGMIEVVNEQIVNGATERTYALVGRMVRFTGDEAAELSAEDHSQLFSIFAAGLIDSFTRYVDGQDSAEFISDGLSYNQAVVYLSDEERDSFQRELITIVERVLTQPPAPERKRYTLSSVVIPGERDTHL